MVGGGAAPGSLATSASFPFSTHRLSCTYDGANRRGIQFERSASKFELHLSGLGDLIINSAHLWMEIHLRFLAHVCHLDLGLCCSFAPLANRQPRRSQTTVRSARDSTAGPIKLTVVGLNMLHADPEAGSAPVPVAGLAGAMAWRTSVRIPMSYTMHWIQRCLEIMRRER